MANYTYLVRPLAYYDNTGAAAVGPHPDYSDFYDIGDAVEIHFVINLISLGGSATPTLRVTAQSSVDGVHWTDIGSTAATITAVGGVNKTLRAATSGEAFMKYCRFKYDFSAGTSPTAVFSVTAIIKTRDGA